MPLFHPSGGLFYHLRARRYRATLWRPFHAAVAAWLAAWQPGRPHLVLVGPSGGYALPAPFLQRFARVTVLEPDPLARFILARRFPGVAFRFAASAGLARPEGFAWLAERHPDAALLFCNLLGQEPIGQGAGFERGVWLAGLASALSGRAWASWHDLASTARAPQRHGVIRLPRAQALEALLARYWAGGELEIVDHECTGLCPDLPREYAIWPLRPGQYHLVEWLCREPAADARGLSSQLRNSNRPQDG